MLDLINTAGKHPLSVTVLSDIGERMTFNIAIIKRVDQVELAKERQFELFNTYVNSKGDIFKDKLFELYTQGHQEIMRQIMQRKVNPMPVKMIHDVLDLFDMEDIKNFVNYHKDIHIPSTMPEKFDEKIESDGLGTRAQTFTHDEYRDLIALTIPFKAILPLLGQYSVVKLNEIGNNDRLYMLYNLFNTHKIMESPGVLKLRAMVTRLLFVYIAGDIEAAVTIEKGVPKTEMVDFVLAQVLISKVGIGAGVTDTDKDNIVTRIYRYIINRIKPKNDFGNKISDKKPLSDADSTTGERESSLEVYRFTAEQSIGTICELDWAASDLDILIRDMGVDIPDDIINAALAVVNKYDDHEITDGQITILAMVFKNIIDPRGIAYISLGGIKNLMVIAVGVLWALDQKAMAVFLLSVGRMVSGNEISLSPMTSRNMSLSQEVRDVLYTHWPHERVINKVKTVNVCEESISLLCIELRKYNWVPLLPSRYLKLAGVKNRGVITPDDLKTVVAKMLIRLEEKVYE